MKNLTVTRTTHSASFKKCRNLGQLIAVIEKEGESQDLFIVRLKLNGKNLDHEEENLLDNLSIEEVDSLEVQMASINEIVGKSITDIIAKIQDTQLLAIKFCKEFRKENSVDDEKVKYILIQCRAIIDGLEELFKTHMSQLFHIKHHSLWIESEKELTNILQCILQSRKMTDFNFVSDLIEYDLVQALDQWEEALEKELIDNPTLNGIFRLKRRGINSDNGVDV